MGFRIQEESHSRGWEELEARLKEIKLNNSNDGMRWALEEKGIYYEINV